MDGQNVLGRWTTKFSDESDLSVQLYWDRTFRRDIPSTITDELNTYDYDFQHRFPLGERNSILWGAGYRLMEDRTPTSTALVGFVPEQRTMQLYSGFVQDEITLIEDRLKFTLGTKLEHNVFSGFEVQPSTRLAWTPTERQTFWGAVSRARALAEPVRCGLSHSESPAVFHRRRTDFESETVIAYELGYRVQPWQKLSLSLAGFYNNYDDIYNVQTVAFPLTIENGAAGESWGAELSFTFQPLDCWRLRGGYTYFTRTCGTNPGMW